MTESSESSERPTYSRATADTMREDADLLTEQALRLRDAAESIRGESGVPEWFDETIRNQIGRCVVAAEDLRIAADLLDEHDRSMSA